MENYNKPKAVLLAEFEEDFFSIIKEESPEHWEEIKEGSESPEYQEMIDRCISLSRDERVMRLMDFDLDDLTTLELLEINFIKKLRNDSGEAAAIQASVDKFQKLYEENPDMFNAAEKEPTFFEKIGNFFKRIFS